MFASDVLSRPQAVALLAQAAEALPRLAQAGLRLALLGRDTCALMRPENPGTRQDQAALAVLDPLLEAVTGASRWTREPGVNLANLWTPGQAVIHILLNTPPPDHVPPVTPADEVLLLVRKAPDWLEARILDMVHADATQLRFAPATDGEGQRLLLVLVQDDVTRGSLFGALRDAGILEQAVVLRGYGQPVKLFVPDAVALDAGLLAPALAVLSHGVSLFGLEASQGQPLLAFNAEPVAEGRRWRVKTLVPVDPTLFFADHALWPQSGEYADLSVLVPVPDPHRAETIQETLRRHGVTEGYRLRLVRGLPASTSQAEVESLANQLQELELELQARRGLAHEDLVLVRFTPLDLPALAALLRSLPPSELASGSVRYAFQASGDGQGGDTHRHYLLFDASRLGHLTGIFDASWQRSDAGPLSFWVDPIWRAAYGGLLSSAVQSRVFVPHGSTLHPTLHSWAGEDMDTHLRAILPSLTHAATRLPQPLPPALYFVFEDEPGEDRRLGLHLLTPEMFSPLMLRLGFLNDMLVLYDTVGPEQITQVTDLVASLARESRHHPTLAHLQAQTQEREAALCALSSQARERSLGDVETMLKAIEAQMEAAVETIQAHAGGIAEIHEALAALSREVQRADATAEALGQALQEAPGVAGQEAKRHAETVRRVQVLARDTEAQHTAALALIQQRLAWLGEQVRRVRRLKL